MGQIYCVKCGKMLDQKEFYKSKNKEKYPPDGYLNTCKKCITMHVDNWDPETYKWILKEIDVPYIKEEWDAILEKELAKSDKVTNLTILGKYLAKMRIVQYKNETYADSDKIAAKNMQRKVNAMKAQGMSQEEIDEHLSKDTTPPKPGAEEESSELPQDETAVSNEEDEDVIGEELTPDDQMYLRLKWGRGYRPEEWVRMEQLYKDMMASYDIQTAGHKDTLILLCKTSLKANQCVDAGDIEGYQKLEKVYDSLMKSGNFTAAQNKGDSGDFIDSVGELVAICEKEGFIPQYYVDQPQDKVDKTLQDLQHYTHTLVTEEMNLGNMIESSLREIVKDREREAQIDVEDGDLDEEDSMFSYDPVQMTDEDYQEYEDMIEAQRIDDIREEEEG